MKTVAIICEYNPFHNGHKLQIEKIRCEFGDCRILSLMSGSFVQRGETAVMLKYDRAEIAISEGADAVLELPYPYSGGSAEYFARGAVSILDSLGSVDILCFGSERGDIASLERTAENMLSAQYVKKVNTEAEAAIATSEPYIQVCKRVYENLYGKGFPEQPNDILAVEYIKALKLKKSPIEPFTYKREAGFSATEARRCYEDSNFERLEQLVPESAYEKYTKYGRPDSIYTAGSAILAFLRLAETGTLSKYADMNPGMEALFAATANESATLREFYDKCATKKYTNAKIRRAVLNCILGTTEEMLKSEPLYTTLLAANEEGCRLLNIIRKTSRITVLTKPAHYKRMDARAKARFEHALRAESFYTLTLSVPVAPSELLKVKPIIFKT